MANFKQELKRDKKYIDLLPVKNSDADIIFIPTKKGTGKTYGAIREMLIAHGKNKLPSAYVRSTYEQLKEFAGTDKFGALLDDLGYKMPRNERVTTKGLMKLKYKTRKSPNREMEPIIYFLSINQAMNIQSSKFKPLNLLVLDEVQHHFRQNKEATFNKTINLISSVLRHHNCPIWFIFNKVDINDIFLQLFKISNVVNSVKPGHIKKFKRDFKVGKKISSFKIAIYNPKQSKKFFEDGEKAIGNKLSTLSEYGAVINSDNFYIKHKNIAYIKTLTNFKSIININGYKIGLWINPKSGRWQFSKKYNKTGKIWYFSYLDFNKGSFMGSFDFIKDLKQQIIRQNVEFEDAIVFDRIIDLLKIR